MKKLALLITVFVAALSACTKEKDPYLAALETEIAGRLGEGAKVNIEIFSLIDSTTFGEELKYRQEVFDLRLKQNMKLLERYKQGGFVNSAVDKRNAINHDHEVIAGLADMERSLEPILGNVAYYDFCFSGSAKKGDSRAVYKEYYASITPQGEVVSIDSNKKTLHKALGRVIPGYLELVKGEDAD
ncbi:MAG: hypothetical protein J5699_01645 [Bacteroidales bacterium]|nr:hypothetical protein [Bacteroidales bacterium]